MGVSSGIEEFGVGIERRAGEYGLFRSN